MKLRKRVLSWMLAVMMALTTVFGLGVVPVAASGSTGNDTFIKIVFVDCGRKYFSVSSLKSIIDNAASAGFTHVQLGIGNDGLRFLLDDLSLTVGGTTYTSAQVSAGLHSGNEAYSNFTVDELTESEMDEILAYAKSKSISIIPLINTPGHMDAIVDCMEYCGLSNVAYAGSARTVDVTNSTAVAFTQTLVKKYAEYFAKKGCTYFNMGSDEYANDKYTSGSMGFGNLISSRKYGSFVSYVNGLASIIKDAGMTPMAFNDGIYFNNTTSYGTFDNDIVILYWSSGWSGYTPMSASTLHNTYGFEVVNTHGDYYWVLGKSDWQCTATKASGFNVNSFQGSTISDPYGACFCIWCDYPQADTDTNVVKNTAAVIAAFGSALPESKGQETPKTTQGNPFPQGTAGSNSFRIPSLVTLSDGTLVAAADARWNTVYDGGGLDTLVSVSKDGGENWTYAFANYLGDNGNVYNGSSSTAFIDPAMAVDGNDTVYLLCDLYPYGVALNGSGNTAPSTSLAFDGNGNLKLAAGSSTSYSYYLDLSDYTIRNSSGTVVSGYTVDEHFNIKGTNCDTNLFCADSPYKVVRTGYLYLTKSTDGGKSWSAPTLLNLKTSSEMACLVAPGNSVVTADGTVVFPVYSYNGSNESQRVSFIYSKDSGATWQRSESLSYNWGSESECVELADGTLRFFFRNNNCKICYADAKASASGYAWSTPVVTNVSVNSNTQLSALSYSKTLDGKQAILISCPAGSEASGSNSSAGTARVNGKIFVGLVDEDGSMNFAYSMSVPSVHSANRFGYSALTENKDGSIAILYEDYTNGWGSGDDCLCKMNFATYLISAIAPGAAVGEKALSGSREEVNFDDGWKFHLGDVSDAYAASFDDSAWDSVTLPHDFSISQSYTTSGEAESGFLPGGTGWYRKSFSVEESEIGKTFLLNFDGVYSDAYVYCNGQYVGEHHYGYSAFAVDLTEYVKSGSNVIAVKAVNNIPSSRWYSGSGIYRDVTLISANPVHIALNGTAVTTPDIASGKGTVQVSAEIVNDSAADKTVTVTANIYRKNSSVPVASGSKSVTVKAGSTVSADISAVVSSPALWSTDDPNLYTVQNVVTVDGKEVDAVTDDFGFRWTEFDGTKGFSLNGETVKLNGVCLHHDQGGLGAAAYSDAIERQLRLMKDMGVNAIRTTHNPADENLIALCNELGLMVIEEAFDGWSQPKNGNSNDFSKYFNATISADNGLVGAESGETYAQYAITSMVRRDRNAPCVILWSLGNEITEGTSTSCSAYPTIAKNLIAYVQAQDTSRPVTIGDNTRVTDKTSVMGQVLSAVQSAGGVVGFNYASSSQLSSLNSYWGALVSSETTSATNSRDVYVSQSNNAGVDGEYHLTSYDTSAVSWGKTAHASLYDTLTKDYISGEFVWTGFDYLGEPTPYNGTGSGSVTGSGAMPNSSYFGIADTTGFVKDTFYFYRSQWNTKENTLHLVTAWDADNQYTTNGKTPVVIYSNAAKVELYRNGSLIGTATGTRHTTAAGHTYITYTTASDNTSVCTAVSGSGSTALYATFNVTYASGIISAKAYDESGKEITDSCAGETSVSTPGAAAKIRLTAEKGAANTGELVYFDVEITDVNGIFDTTAEPTINITLSGSGKILAVDNGDQATTKKGQQPSVLTSDTAASLPAYAGRALVIVQAGEGDEAITLTATASGLETAISSVSVNGGEIPDAPDEPEKAGFVDPDGGEELLDALNLSGDEGTTLTARFAGSKGTPAVSVGNLSVAAASLSNGTVSITLKKPGETTVTVSYLGKTYPIALTVYKAYAKQQTIELDIGESTTFVDETGDYEAAYTKDRLDEAIASVTVQGTTVAAVPAVEGGLTKQTTLGSTCLIGYVSGSSKYFLTASGSSLSYTNDASKATVWSVSGSGSSIYLKSGSYYLRHNNNSLGLSTSTSNATWSYSSSKGFYYSSSTKSFFSSRTSTYYLCYSSGFKLSTSSTKYAAAYTVAEGTPGVEGKAYTTITISGLSGGETKVGIGDTLYTVKVKSPHQVITVYTVDDVGKTLKDSYTISGAEGTLYTVDAPALYGYVAPQPVSGTFTGDVTGTITLIYNLNTDKNALKNALDAAITEQGEYTDATYQGYAAALAAAKTVYNKPRATQTEVDEALSALNDARDALTDKVYTVTVHFTDAWGDKLAEDETQSGKKGEVYAFTPAPIDNYDTPEAVSGTFAKDDSFTLVYVLNTDKSTLKTLLDEALPAADYTTASFAPYSAALISGKAVYDNAKAKQGDVDQAVKAINDAKDALAELTYGSITVHLIDDAGETIGEDIFLEGETGTTYTVILDPIENYDTPDPITGSFGKNTADEANAVYVLNTDKTALKRLLDETLAESDYTAVTYVPYKQAMTDGKTVYDNARAMQTEVNAAVTAIENAKAALKKNGSTFTLDTDGIDSGSEYVLTNTSGYALGVSNGSITATKLTASNSALSNVSDNYVWIITGNTSNGYVLKNKSTGTYLTYSTSSNWFTISYTLKVSSTQTAWKRKTSGSYTRLYATASRKSLYLRYSSGFGIATSATSSCNLMLYKAQ